MSFERITVEPDKMGGSPASPACAFPVATVLAMVADNMTPEQVVAEFQDLEIEGRGRGVAQRRRIAPRTRTPLPSPG
jgi:hypothetical protein